MKRLFPLLLLIVSITASAVERENIWPKGKMPDRQSGQSAVMTDDARRMPKDALKQSEAYLEWFDAPAKDVRKNVCMILVPGGAYEYCSTNYIEEWNRKLTAEGIQCVNLVYRTPRPQGLPIYQTAWEDAQRAVRMVRSEAKRRGFDPERIGAVGMSAGSHLALLMAANSQTRAYAPVDKLDSVDCHINWAILHAPAYVTTDSEFGTTSSRQGYGIDVKLSSAFKFDSKTCPMSLHHGGLDPYSPNGSTLIYRQLRRMGVPAELHILPNITHRARALERGIEFMRQMGFLGKPEAEVALMERFTSDEARKEHITEDIWPEGKMPDEQANQCKPYIEWHIPKVLRTRAIQIIYSGGAYQYSKPEDFEVAPIRRYLNEQGMAVVTMHYRTPRPSKASGLAKHTTAWQDLQRAIRIVRSEAAGHGLCKDSIGIMGSSAGGHLTLMGVTSSMHQSYNPIDAIDKLPCNVQWGIAIYPAYVLTDGLDGQNRGKGNDDSAMLSPDFSFDLRTAPTLFLHGDADGYSSMGSVKVWEKMRSMGIQSELHTLATRSHCFQKTASPGTGSYTWLDRIKDFLQTTMRLRLE